MHLTVLSQKERCLSFLNLSIVCYVLQLQFQEQNQYKDISHQGNLKVKLGTLEMLFYPTLNVISTPHPSVWSLLFLYMTIP